MHLHSAIQYDYRNEPHLYLSSWIVIKTTSLSNDNHHTFARKIYSNSMKSRTWTWMHVPPLTVGWLRERRRMKKRVICSIDHRHLATSTLSFGSNSISYWFSNDAVNGRCAGATSILSPLYCNFNEITLIRFLVHITCSWMQFFLITKVSMLQMNIRKMSFDIDSMQSIQQHETTLDYIYST